MAHPIFSCDCSAQAEAFPHFWEHTIGSGHATLALRADYQAQLKRCQEELGFRHVRFHGILCDDMGTFLIYNDQPFYSFFNTDRIFDFLLSIGMKPFVELSFMPTGLSSGDKTVFHYRANVTPPRDYAMWATLISKLAAHLVERYGLAEVSQWFFEVWNEPNLDAFYTGRQEDYFKLYQYTALALKSVDGSLKVGGPVTAANAWIPEFIKFTEERNLPVDFISSHHYPTDAFGSPGDDTVTQLSKSERSILRKQVETAKAQAKDKPLYYTEWSSSSNPRDGLHDEPYCAAFITKTIMEAKGLLEAYSYWTFSDIFEENYMPSMPFHGGFGLLTIHGIAKPAYRAYQLLHRLGDEIYKVKDYHETVDVWVVKSQNEITVLLTNFALPHHNLETETVHITLENFSGKADTAHVCRIDEEHCNPRKLWEANGSPEYPNDVLLKELHKASELCWEKQEFSAEGRTVSFEIKMAPQSVAAVTFKFEK